MQNYIIKVNIIFKIICNNLSKLKKVSIISLKEYHISDHPSSLLRLETKTWSIRLGFILKIEYHVS